MHKSPRFKACVLAVAMATLPIMSHAAGLGRLNVMSGLGQPLRGEIDLVSVQPNEADSLVVSLAPPESYSNAQIPYPPASLGLRFNIEKRANGQYYVVVNSSQPITEPFIDLLVELNWAAGRIQREYTALIDPADYTGGANAERAARYASSDLPGTQTKGAIKGAKAKKARVADSSAETKAPSEAPKKESRSAEGDAGAAASGQHKVKSGETLGAIAREVQPAGVSLEQVLVSLYKNNPNAFDGNLNRLKSGKILNVPAAEQMQQISKQEASKEVAVQAADWKSYRTKLAESAAKAPAKELGEQASGGKITAKVQDHGQTAADANKDVLKLSKAADAAKKAGDQAKVKALEEEIAARQKALDEANQRVAMLQKNVTDMEKLAAMKASAAAAATAAPTSAPTAAASATAVAASEVAASEPVAASGVASAVATAKPKRRVQIEAPVEEETSLVDDLLGNPLVLGGGALALALGLGGVWYSRRRKQPSVFEDSIITGGDLKANTVLGSTGGGVISTQATENSFLTDFSRQGLGTIDTDEVDPIAEAEVYMAYGRDAQAEEILKDALQKDPSRLEIRMKLLDIYAARKDTSSYEEHASTLFAITNGQGEFWRDAAMNGRAIDPENPLYQKEPAGMVDTSKLAAVAAPAAVAAAAVALSEPAVALDEPTAPDAQLFANNDLDFELDLDKEVAAVAEPIAAAAVLEPASALDLSPDDNAVADFDLDLDAEQNVEAAIDSLIESDFAADTAFEPQAAVEPGAMDDGMLSLDLPIDLGADLSETALADVKDDLSFELPAVEAPLESALDIAAPAVEEIESFDLDLPAAGAPETALEAAALDDASALDLDFDFDLGSSAAEAAPELGAVATSLEADTTFGDISLDLSQAAAAGELDFAADDPVQTKIDLAKAYIDMGDVEGAREILQEALQEGNGEQQATAKGLLDEL
ncbi:FimV/HubP family polar landmark protein [Chitinibacter tainanensis]|uniref:FimV/HubP family polar landmark protein n=1 Tax=Chitinibacter tainanensis TaxID=230667 RepID=UPI0012EC3179|nr:FimV/HubP family polar landmark protein [Chitinibacter tainanensis]